MQVVIDANLRHEMTGDVASKPEGRINISVRDFIKNNIYSFLGGETVLLLAIF